MKGYKVFNPDWKCLGFQYEVGKTYEMKGKPKCCSRGFHFCKDLKDCFSYYSFDPDNRVAKVLALGDIDEELDNLKCCTNKIQIVEEISWETVLQMVNTGKACSGFGNSGNRNSGNRNSGDGNSGNRNSGNSNSGNWNSGNWNSGDCNSGNRNSGNRNSGNSNSGNWNSGDGNSGNRNSGDWNSGDWNKTSFSNGCFNMEEPKIYLFDKPSKWTYRDWFNSDARYILEQIPTRIINWVLFDDMTDEEKERHPECKTTGGFLKVLEPKQGVQEWWNDLSDNQKNIIKGIPNFDATIFEKITGIKAGD